MNNKHRGGWTLAGLARHAADGLLDQPARTIRRQSRLQRDSGPVLGWPAVHKGAELANRPAAIPAERPARRRALRRAECLPISRRREGGAHARVLQPTRLRASVSDIIEFRPRRDEMLWAVVASIGRKTRVAEIFPSRERALADREWREQQIRAYRTLLQSCKQPAPSYSVAPIKFADLPRSWKPLPALGFLRGQFI